MVLKNNTLEQVSHVAQAKAGYIIASGVGSTPIWVSTLTDVAQLIAVLLAIAVGATTFYMNMRKIKYYKDKENGKD